VRSRLERWLRTKTSPDAQVTDLSVPSTNGMSSETVVFDATWTPPGESAAHSAALVARMAPDVSDVPVFPAYDLDRQVRLIGIDRPEPTPFRRHAGDQGEYYRWAMDGLRVPVLERAFAWLDDHLPSDEGPTVLSWGDARIGNILYRDFAPVGVLDWEMALLGPR